MNQFKPNLIFKMINQKLSVKKQAIAAVYNMIFVAQVCFVICETVHIGTAEDHVSETALET